MTVFNTKRHLLCGYFSKEIFWLVRFSIVVFTSLNTLEISVGLAGFGLVYQFRDPPYRKGIS
jgi:hypothetical protein